MADMKFLITDYDAFKRPNQLTLPFINNKLFGEKIVWGYSKLNPELFRNGLYDGVEVFIQSDLLLDKNYNIVEKNLEKIKKRTVNGERVKTYSVHAPIEEAHKAIDHTSANFAEMEEKDITKVMQNSATIAHELGENDSKTKLVFHLGVAYTAFSQSNLDRIINALSKVEFPKGVVPVVENMDMNSWLKWGMPLGSLPKDLKRVCESVEAIKVCMDYSHVSSWAFSESRGPHVNKENLLNKLINLEYQNEILDELAPHIAHAHVSGNIAPFILYDYCIRKGESLDRIKTNNRSGSFGKLYKKLCRHYKLKEDLGLDGHRPIVHRKHLERNRRGNKEKYQDVLPRLINCDQIEEYMNAQKTFFGKLINTIRENGHDTMTLELPRMYDSAAGSFIYNFLENLRFASYMRHPSGSTTYEQIEDVKLMRRIATYK